MKLKILHLIKVLLNLFISFENIGGALYKENVLIIIVDDMRPLLAEWGDRTAQTPHINQLARKSVLFKNAFAQAAKVTARNAKSIFDIILTMSVLPDAQEEATEQALCAPSRNSLLTGRRPDSLRLYDFYSYWRDDIGNFTTLPQYFKDNGYDTYSLGKVFHPGKSSNFTDDYPYSWSSIPYHPPTDIYKDAKVCVDKSTGKFAKNLVCPVEVGEQPGKSLPDLQTVNTAIQLLNNRTNDRPFFLAVGLHKPHIPLKYPRKYLDLYPLENISIAKQPNRPYNMPLAAWNPWTDLRNLKMKNVDQPVELVDLMPTLAELTGLTTNFPSCSFDDKELLCSEGKSLLPVMGFKLSKELPDAVLPTVAFSQFPRPSVYPKWNSDKPRLKNIKIMGYSVRSIRFRYTEWVEFDVSNFRKNWNVVYGIELYDHLIDKEETINLADRKGHQSVLAMFAYMLRQKFQ